MYWLIVVSLLVEILQVIKLHFALRETLVPFKIWGKVSTQIYDILVHLWTQRAEIIQAKWCYQKDSIWILYNRWQKKKMKEKMPQPFSILRLFLSFIKKNSIFIKSEISHSGKKTKLSANPYSWSFPNFPYILQLWSNFFKYFAPAFLYCHSHFQMTYDIAIFQAINFRHKLLTFTCDLKI